MVTKPKIASKNCSLCGSYLPFTSYYPTKSKFHSNGILPICKVCLEEIVDVESWASMDKFCQWADYPFIPDVWTKLHIQIGTKALDAYIKAYTSSNDYSQLSWKEVQDEWQALINSKEYKKRIPEFTEEQMANLQHKWGSNYNIEELEYMDSFFNSLCKSHNIITETQRDAAKNLAKLSVRISKKISNDLEVDKDIRSYNDLMKSAGLTVENVKDMSDFESVGELVAYLEKSGWENPYHRNEENDVVDKTMTNIQGFLRRVVMGETHLKDSVDKRLAALGLNEAGEIDLDSEDFDDYDTNAFEDIEVDMVPDEDETGEMIVDET